MIYQSSTGKLYLLLSACAPQNTLIQARLFNEEIMQSVDYQRLLQDPQGQSLLHDILHGNPNEKLTVASKSKRLSAISLCCKLLDELPKVIQNRDTAQLTPEDLPNFASPESVQQLLRKLNTLPKGHTYSNLNAQNSLQIFSPSTLRSSSTVLPMLTPRQLEHAVQAFPSALAGHPYCIAEATLCLEVEQMQRLLDESNSHLILERRSKHRRRLLKGILLLVVITIYMCLNILHVMPLAEATIFLLFGLLTTGLLMIAG